MKLTNPTDDELNEAFAEHVAGWKDIYAKEVWQTDGKPGGWFAYEKRGVPPGSETHKIIPRFTESADAVLPWLEKCGWRGTSNPWCGNGTI